MKKILVGINFSEQSRTVIKFALRLAQYHTCQLTVVHVVNFEDREPNQNFVPGEMGKSMDYEEFRLKKLDELNSFMQKYFAKQFHSIRIETQIRFGNSNEELRVVAKEINPDLLVVGKRTKTGRIFFSDTADKLITYANCPIFIVPEDADFNGFKRIVYASDFILEDCESLFFLLPWLAVFDAELICLHICKNKVEEPKAKRKLATLDKLFPQENISFRSVVYDVGKGIDRYVHLTKSDMVATIHRDRNLWDSLFKKSVSKTIASDAKIPMIIFQQSNH